MLLRILMLMAAWLAGTAGQSFADGTQYNGACTGIAWDANTETDLAGYHLYDRTSTALPNTQIKTYGVQITTATCASLGLNAGQHYLSLAAFDASGNEGQSTVEVPFVIIANNTVADLRVTAIGATDLTLAWTEVDGGIGAPATYDVRFKTPTMDWGNAASVTSGTCGSAVAGTTIGATKTCTITGLSMTTPYEVQLVPYRGLLGSTAVYGPLSNVAGATTGGTIEDLDDRTVTASFAFNVSDGALGDPWEGGYTAGPSVPGFTVVSERIRASSTTSDSTMTYNGALENNQWCEIVMPTVAGAGVRAVSCLLAATAPGLLSAYDFTAYVSGGSVKSRIRKWINGQIDPSNLVDENTSVWTAADVLRAEKRGSQLTLFHNGTQLLTVNDSSFTGGRGGVILYSGTSVADLEADNVRFGGFAPVGAGDTCGCDNH